MGPAAQSTIRRRHSESQWATKVDNSGPTWISFGKRSAILQLDAMSTRGSPSTLSLSAEGGAVDLSSIPP